MTARSDCAYISIIMERYSADQEAIEQRRIAGALFNGVGQTLYDSVALNEATGLPRSLDYNESLETVSRQQNGCDVEVEITRLGNSHFLYQSTMVLPAERLRPRVAIDFFLDVTPRNYLAFMSERCRGWEEDMREWQPVKFDEHEHAERFAKAFIQGESWR